MVPSSIIDGAAISATTVGLTAAAAFLYETRVRDWLFLVYNRKKLQSIDRNTVESPHGLSQAQDVRIRSAAQTTAGLDHAGFGDAGESMSPPWPETIDPDIMGVGANPTTAHGRRPRRDSSTNEELFVINAILTEFLDRGIINDMAYIAIRRSIADPLILFEDRFVDDVADVMRRCGLECAIASGLVECLRGGLHEYDAQSHRIRFQTTTVRRPRQNAY